MNGTVVIIASHDRREISRLCELLNHRGISATIETRTVAVGGKAAHGYRLRVPSELLVAAQTTLALDFEMTGRTGEKAEGPIG